MPVFFLLIVVLVVFYGARCFNKLFFKYTKFSKKARYLFSGLSFFVLFLLLFLYGDLMFGFLVHLLICFLISDIFAMVIKIPAVGNFLKSKKKLFKFGQTVLVVFAALSLTVFGYFNAKNICVKRYSFEFDSKKYSDTRIMFVSDLHLNSKTGEATGEKILETALKEKPDVIIFGGDILDQSSSEKDLEYIAGIISALSDEAEVLCVFGNHDFGLENPDEEKIISEFENAGANFLVDSTATVNGIEFIGRMESAAGRSGKSRKSIEQLSSADSEALKVVIDHQPKELSSLDDAGIDISFSGHTHNGQIFPLGTLCSVLGINELEYGVEKFGETVCVVSSGVSTWGMRVRSQGRSEIVIADFINGQK